MFSGIIEEIGTITSTRSTPKGKRISISAKAIFKTDSKQKIKKGDSLSVSGVCLTIETIKRQVVSATAVQETLERTNLGLKKRGDEVNLERPLTLTEGISGHLVQGHIDGLGSILSWDSETLAIKIPKHLRRYLLPKGSLAIDGISLTIARIEENGTAHFAIIPYTAQHTALRSLKAKDKVNLEIDLVAKAIYHYLSEIHPK